MFDIKLPHGIKKCTDDIPTANHVDKATLDVIDKISKKMHSKNSPEYVDLVGDTLASQRMTCHLLQKSIKKLTKTRDSIMNNMQETCPHEYMAVYPGENGNQASYRNNEQRVCMVCGLEERDGKYSIIDTLSDNCEGPYKFKHVVSYEHIDKHKNLKLPITFERKKK